MRKRVVITGAGAVSPVGNTLPETWEALIAGKSGAAPITSFDASPLKTRFAAEVKGFDITQHLGSKEGRRLDRFAQFAMVSTMEALDQSGLRATDDNRDRIGVLVGSGIGGVQTLYEQLEIYRTRGADRVSPFLVPMMITDSAAGNIAIRFGFRGPNLSISTACATGSNSIGEAVEMIRRGAADAMVAGASEAAVVPVAMAGLNVMTALSTRNDDPERASRPFDKDRDGFLIAEGGAVIVLEFVGLCQGSRRENSLRIDWLWYER